MQLKNDNSAEGSYDITVNVTDIIKAAAILKALNHSLRQKILRIIHENKSITVTQLYLLMRMEQSLISRHLAILRRAKVVTLLRQGSYRHYSIDTVRVEEIKKLSKELEA